MTEITEVIAAGADDIYSDIIASGTYLYPSEDHVRLQPSDGTTQTLVRIGGLRFTTVAVPQGATINSADIIVVSGAVPYYTFPSGTTNPPNIIGPKVYGGDVDDAPAITAGGDVAGLAKTPAATGGVGYSVNTTVGTSRDTMFNLTFGVTNVVQTIVDRGGWSSGNDMSFAMYPHAVPTATGVFYEGFDFYAEEADYPQSTYTTTYPTTTTITLAAWDPPPATLVIDYTAGGGGSTRLIKMGASEVDALKVGTSNVSKVYLGTNLLFDG